MKNTNIILGIITIVLLIIISIFYFFFDRPFEYNCSNFSTYRQAVKVFKEHPIDIYHLDADHDGVPCEMLVNR